MRTEGKQLQQGQTYLQAYESQLKSTGLSLKNIGTSAKNVFGKFGAGLINTLSGMALGALVSTGISLVGKFIDDLHDTEKELAEIRQEIIDAAETAKSEFESIKSNIDSTTSTADELGQKYAELAQGVRNLGKANQSQGTLSNDEYQEFLDISNQLSDLFPTLTQSYDENGNAILRLSGNVDTITESLNEFVSAEQALASIELQKQLPNIWQGYSLEIDDATTSLSNAESKISDISDAYNELLYSLNSGVGVNIDGSNSQIIDELLAGSNYTSDDLFFNSFDLSQEEINKLKEHIESNYAILTQTYIKEANKARNTINTNNKNFANYLSSSLQGDSAYSSLEDEYKAILNGLISNYDFVSDAGMNEVKNSFWNIGRDLGYQKRIQEIKEEFIGNVSLTDEEKELFKEQYNQLLEIDTSKSLAQNIPVIREYINNLADILGIEADKLEIALGYNLEDDEQKIKDAEERLGYDQDTSNGQVRDRNKQIKEFVKSLSDEEIGMFLDVEIPEYVYDNLSEELDDWWEEEKNRQLEIEADIVSPTAPLDDIKDAYSGFESIYEDIHNGTSVAADSIESLNEAFGTLDGGNALQEFKDVLTTMPDDIDAQQEALNKLATAYLDNSDLLQNLTEENKDYVISELKKIGVVNAEEVVLDRLADKTDWLSQAEQEYANLMNNTVASVGSTTDAKYRAYLASIDLENATFDEVSALIAEANAAGQSSTALVNYLNQSVAAGKMAITTDGSIKNMAALADQITGTNYVTAMYARMQDALNRGAYGEAAALESKIKTETYRVSYLAGKNTNTVIQYQAPSISGGAGGGSGSGSSASETSETFDWVETKINRLEEAISRLDKTVNNTYTNWTNRNSALSQEMSKVREEISLQQQAYNRYIQEANRVGLSSTYARKIQSGELNIETIKDEGLINKINSYKEWYEKAVACSDAIQDLNIQLGELAQQQFDNIQQEYSDLISLIEGSADLVDERINRTEEQGYFASSSYYQQMLNYEAQEMARLKEEYNKLIDQRNAAVSSGAITQGSEAYQAMTQEIQGVHQAIEESTTAMVEFNNAIRDLNWEIFDYIEERIGKIAEESNFLIDLLDNQSLYNDNGSFNNRGQSAAYLHGQNAKIYTQQAQDYANELRKINADLAKDPSNKTLIERREELLDLQQESISNLYAEKEAVKSLVEEGINLHLSKLTELIDKYKESMNSAKDLYEYQKNISDQTSEISRLQKILKSYEGMDDTEEARKSIQDYQNQLKDAETNLKETEWDKYISESEKLLDDLYSDYEETLNARLDNIDTLFTDVINGANANAYMINETIKSVAQAVGYDISMINKNPQDIKKSIQQKTTSIPSLRGYATGSRYIDKDQLAWTQENGTEIIYRASDGALLTPLNQGDMVFTNEMSKQLFDIANGNLPDFISGFKVPTMVAKANATSVNNQNAISINLPNVTNYNEFKNALQKDSKFVGFMQEVTLGQALGKNKLNKNKF